MRTLVTLGFRGSIAVITLNRPERHNALVPELLEQLLLNLESASDSGASAVVIAAAGRSFSTGGDLLGFWEHRDDIEHYSQTLVGLLNETILSIATHPEPIGCAVNGQVTGGSIGLVLASDLAVMHENASITPWYQLVGFSPDGGWRAMLPRVIGDALAERWVAQNETRTAEECLKLGVASGVCQGDVTEATILALDAPSGPPRNHTWNRHDLQRSLEIEREDFVSQIQTETAISGIKRYLNIDT